MPPGPDPTYGADQHGLVWAYRFLPGQPGRSVDVEEAVGLLRLGAPGDGGFVWIHVSLSHSGAIPWLRAHATLPDGFYDSLGGDVGSTRVEQDGDALVAVLHDVMFDFSFDASAVATASLCITPRLVVSARVRPLRSLDQLRTAVRGGEVFASPMDLFAQLLRAQADVLLGVVRHSAARIDRVEDHLLARRVSATRPELGTLRRTLVRLQRLLAPEPAAFFRLLSRPPVWVDDRDRQELRQAAEEFAAAVSDTEALVERLAILQDELSGIVGEQTNRTLFALTAITALAVPINLGAALFGMNVGGIPLATSPYGFLAIAGVLAVVTAGLAYWTFASRE